MTIKLFPLALMIIFNDNFLMIFLLFFLIFLSLLAINFYFILFTIYLNAEYRTFIKHITLFFFFFRTFNF